MPRTTLTKTTSPGPYPTTVQTVTMTAADTTNKNQFALTGREIVIIQNTDTVARTVTITSTTDPQGRTGDISAVSLAAGAIAVVGPFGLPGWIQTDGMLYLEASAATVKFGVVTLPDTV